MLSPPHSHLIWLLLNWRSLFVELNVEAYWWIFKVCLLSHPVRPFLFTSKYLINYSEGKVWIESASLTVCTYVQCSTDFVFVFIESGWVDDLYHMTLCLCVVCMHVGNVFSRRILLVRCIMLYLCWNVLYCCLHNWWGNLWCRLAPTYKTILILISRMIMGILICFIQFRRNEW